MPKKGVSSECVAHQWLIHSTWKVRHLGTSNSSPMQAGEDGRHELYHLHYSLFVLPVLLKELGRRVPLSVRELFPYCVFKI